jgi:hypothetical protein
MSGYKESLKETKVHYQYMTPKMSLILTNICRNYCLIDAKHGFGDEKLCNL